MEQKKKSGTALQVREGVTSPPCINPKVLSRSGRKKRKVYSPDGYVEGIISGNRTILSQAITLVESSLPEHYDTAQEVIEKCLPYSGNSIRIGITGVPGAGKSTFIETFGLLLAEEGKKPAVLAIDPSSEMTRGSILGDKTRMESLSNHPYAFIRPSPAAGTLGGVARKTRETIVLCEAAGFDIVIVETVGVGQSETSVRSMVDFFLLLMLAGAGDELQGIKRGIMEMADTIAVTKADGANIPVAEMTRSSFQNALNLFPAPRSGWNPQVVTCSAKANKGIVEIWERIRGYVELTKKTGFFDEQRRNQSVIRMHDTINESLHYSFYENEKIRSMEQELEQQLRDGKITSYKAALRLLDIYFKG